MTIARVTANAYLSGTVSNLNIVSTAYAVNVSAGSLLLAVAATSVNENQSFSDNNGNTWTVLLANQWHTNLANGLALAYAKNANAGATTVQNNSVSNASRNLVIAEFTGADTVSPVDGTLVAVSSDTTQNPDPGSVTTTLAGGIVLGVGIVYPTANPTAGTGFTRQFSVAPFASLQAIAIEDQLTAPGTYDPSWGTSEQHWIALGFAFKAGSSSAPVVAAMHPGLASSPGISAPY